MLKVFECQSINSLQHSRFLIRKHQFYCMVPCMPHGKGLAMITMMICFPPYEGTFKVPRIQVVIDVRYIPQIWGGCGFDSLRFPWGKVLKT